MDWEKREIVKTRTELEIQFNEGMGSADLGNGKYFVCGGNDINGEQTKTSNIFNLNNSSSQVIMNMQTARSNFGCAYFKDKVYVMGGYVKNEEITRECEVFDLRTMQWKPLPNLPYALSQIKIFIYKDNVYVIGKTHNQYRGPIALFQLNENKFVEMNEFKFSPILVIAFNVHFLISTIPNKIIILFYRRKQESLFVFEMDLLNKDVKFIDKIELKNNTLTCNFFISQESLFILDNQQNNKELPQINLRTGAVNWYTWSSEISNQVCCSELQSLQNKAIITYNPFFKKSYENKDFSNKIIIFGSLFNVVQFEIDYKTGYLETFPVPMILSFDSLKICRINDNEIFIIHEDSCYFYNLKTRKRTFICTFLSTSLSVINMVYYKGIIFMSLDTPKNKCLGLRLESKEWLKFQSNIFENGEIDFFLYKEYLLATKHYQPGNKLLIFNGNKLRWEILGFNVLDELTKSTNEIIERIFIVEKKLVALVENNHLSIIKYLNNFEITNNKKSTIKETVSIDLHKINYIIRTEKFYLILGFRKNTRGMVFKLVDPLTFELINNESEDIKKIKQDYRQIIRTEIWHNVLPCLKE